MGTDAWGIDDGWMGVDGAWHRVAPETVESLRAAMASPEAPEQPTWFVREGSGPPLCGSATVVLEERSEIRVEHHLPAELPIGYHELHPDDGGPTTRLIVTPTRCPSLPSRVWGVTCQVPALVDQHQRPIGGFGELGELADWASRHGARVLGVNPLGDPLLLTPRQASPYSTSSRRFLDPLLIRIDDRTNTSSVATGRAIDRDASWRAHREALGDMFAARGSSDSGRVSAFALTTPDLALHATFNALVEAYGTGWPAWPTDLHDADSDAVRRAATDLAEEVQFWSWVQWLAHEQLASIAEHTDLMFDLPVGVDPWGYDAWVDAPVLARNVSIGAPPDPFAPDGQDWGLPPYDPVRLRAAGYEPFLSTLRANLRRGAGLRIDHVMQLFRLFWVPPDGTPAQGAYVRWNGQELLDLVALEAVRAGTWVVGEDLGTVEPGIRDLLAERGLGGTKVAWFESSPPSEWPAASLATLSTHDLPTVMGALDGSDPRAGDMADRLHSLGGGGTNEQVLIAAHAALGRSGSDVALASIDDIVGSSARVNLPGVNDYPSWCHRLDVGVEELDDHPTAVAVTTALAAARPAERV